MNVRETRVKKLLYRSWYRGCKETDRIVGGYAKKHIAEFSDVELDELETILEHNDNDLWDWLCDKRETPANLAKNSVFAKLRSFVPSEEV